MDHPHKFSYPFESFKSPDCRVKKRDLSDDKSTQNSRMQVTPYSNNRREVTPNIRRQVTPPNNRREVNPSSNNRREVIPFPNKKNEVIPSPNNKNEVTPSPNNRMEISPSTNNRMRISPRPPLHRDSAVTDSKNGRLMLCKVCGKISRSASNDCCPSGKESKILMSSSISIGPAAKKGLSTTVSAEKCSENKLFTHKKEDKVSTSVKVDKQSKRMKVDRLLTYNKEDLLPTYRKEDMLSIYKNDVNSKVLSKNASDITKVLSSGNNINDAEKKSKAKDVQVVLLDSSDEEVPEVSAKPRLKKAAQRELAKATTSVLKKEMILCSPNKDELKNDIRHLTEIDISSIYEDYVCIKCSHVQIGSYKTMPPERILFMRNGVRFSVSHLTSSQESVIISLPTKYLLKIFWHSDKDWTFLVFYVKEKLAQHIRMQLGMHNQSEFYFDSSSDVESEKKLVIFLKEMSEDFINLLNGLFNGSTDNEEDLFQQIKQCEVKSFISSFTDGSEGHSDISGRMSPTDPNIICHFCPRGLKGAITLTLDDYLCLEEGEFLNDVIIDFYLRYLIYKKLSERACRTHVFSTFFYKRLTDVGGNKNSSFVTNIERRHNRVQNWTKEVDIFKKDFIIIPINKKCHWFLAIICFPYLNHPEKTKDRLKQDWRPLRPTHKKIIVEETIDKDESDYDETGSEYSEDNIDMSEDEEPIKQPCIIIFDSLKGSARTKIVATLRGYLEMEYKRRKGNAKKFDIYTVRGIYPDVPQQDNHYDCGVFMLQFAESFLRCPLQDYSESMCLKNWFSHEDVAPKREQIIQLIKDLRKEQFPNTSFEFPHLLTKSEMKLYYKNRLDFDQELEEEFSNEEEDGSITNREESQRDDNSFSWSDSFRTSISNIKRHLSGDISVNLKKNRLTSDYCDS